MLQTGKNITQAGDLLQKITIQQIYNTIKNPSAELKTRISQLRMVLSLDPSRYRQLKTTLPYFTCGIFNPPYRKTENFGFIEHFVADYDHLDDSEITPESLKSRLIADEQVEMLFASPSGKGLKVMFRLSERCYDRVQFSMFYKIFINAFSSRYGIATVADNRTSDVTRACFLSADEEAWYNPGAAPVKINAYIDFDSPRQVIEANIFLKEQKKEPSEEKESSTDEIDPDILNRIKQRLKPDIRLKREKIIYVPEELEEIIERIQKRMEEFGIGIRSVESIHYGKKFVFFLGDKWAEINVFYGKRGYSVVKTPKRGSNNELADISQQILCELLI